MKKVFFSFLFVALGATALSAQDFSLAAKAGVNISTIASSDLISGISASGNTAFNVGLYAQNKFTPKFALETGFVYSQEGFKLEESGHEGTAKISYINVPVLAKWYVGGKGLSLFAGPQAGIKVGDSVDIGGDIEGLESVVISGIAGIGYDFKFGLLVEANYNFALSKNVSGTDANSNQSLSLGVAQIKVGWRF